MKFDKSRVYTSLNADELKAGDKVIVADCLDSLKFEVEKGAVIQELESIQNEMNDFRFVIERYQYNLAYLVERAKEKKWRPYKDTDEMIEDYKKRFNVDCPDYVMPLIWIKHKEWPSSKYLITGFNKSTIIVTYIEKEFTTLFDDYTYLDGTPCGIEE